MSALTARLRRASGVDAEAGFSLTELLIASLVLGLMMAAVFGVLDISQKAYSRASSMEEIQAGMRSVLDRLVLDIQMVGSDYSGATNYVNTLITEASSTKFTFWGDVDGDTVASNADATTTATAAPGAPTVTVSSATGFCPGEALYIANGVNREVRRISSVSGNTITLSAVIADSAGYASGSIVRSVELVTWEYDSGSGTLTRTITGNSACSSGTTQARYTTSAATESVPATTDTMLTGITSMSFTFYDFAGNTTTTLAAIQAIEIQMTVTGSGGNRRATKFRVQPRSLQLT